MNDRLVLELPMAPTANSHWRAIVMGKGRTAQPRILISKEGRNYRALVERLCAVRNVPKCIGPVYVEGLLFFPTRAGDTDNRIKPTLDALEAANVFTNDSQVMRVDFQRVSSRDPKPGRMLIRITRFQMLSEDFTFEERKRWLERSDL